MKHRTDIDGLRAVAVLPVVAFHAGISQLPGGFVGVDVFFVISGFLIGSIILTDVAQGQFSYASFYSRRFRRILPALFAVLLATTIAAAFILYPGEFADYGRSLAAAALSVSNFYFMFTSDYFDAPAATKPLLHTWSLAVEEQFYLVLPPLLVLGRRATAGHLERLLWCLALISFCFSAYGAYLGESSAFYMLHSRAWELLLGVLVGMRPPPRDRRTAEVAAAAGLGLITFSILYVRESMQFPGVWALPPSVGAALIIWAGGGAQSLTSKLLSWRPITFVGLISYSVYLWHWPIITLYKHDMFRPLTVWDKGLIILVSLLVGAASWRFVEQPFRTKSLSLPAIYRMSIGGSLAVGAFSALIVANGGFPSRFSKPVATMASYLNYPDEETFRVGACMISSKFEAADFKPDICLRDDPRRKDVLLIGDSHAGHLYRGLVDQLPSANIEQATASGCKPTWRRLQHDLDRCRSVMDYVFKIHLAKHRPDLIILSGRWRDGDLAAVGETLDWLNSRGFSVVLAGPVVEYDSDLPRLLAHGLRVEQTGFARSHVVVGAEARDRAFAQLAAAKGVPYASAFRALCEVGRSCRLVADNGAPVQFDYGHLTREGSSIVAAQFVRQGAFSALGDPAGDAAATAQSANAL